MRAIPSVSFRCAGSLFLSFPSLRLLILLGLLPTLQYAVLGVVDGKGPFKESDAYAGLEADHRLYESSGGENERGMYAGLEADHRLYESSRVENERGMYAGLEADHPLYESSRVEIERGMYAGLEADHRLYEPARNASDGYHALALSSSGDTYAIPLELTSDTSL